MIPGETLCEVDSGSGYVVIYLVLDYEQTHTLYRIDSSKMNTRIKQIDMIPGVSISVFRIKPLPKK